MSIGFRKIKDDVQSHDQCSQTQTSVETVGLPGLIGKDLAQPKARSAISVESRTNHFAKLCFAWWQETRPRMNTRTSVASKWQIICLSDHTGAGPTPWISPLVIIPKKNENVRICVDMRMANKVIHWKQHPSPTVDDLIHTLNTATVFSKLYLRSGYHQLSLAPESWYIKKFATHKGLRRYARLNFGTNSASEIFQNAINELIHDISRSVELQRWYHRVWKTVFECQYQVWPRCVCRYGCR